MQYVKTNTTSYPFTVVVACAPSMSAAVLSVMIIGWSGLFGMGMGAAPRCAKRAKNRAFPRR